MTQQQIEQAADGYAAEATPTYINGDFDTTAIAQAFEEGANYVLRQLCNMPFDKLLIELAEFLEIETKQQRQ